MKKYSNKTIIEIAKTFSKSLINDPLMVETCRDIDKKERLLFMLYYEQLKVMNKEKKLDIICLEDNPKIVLIGNDTTKYNRRKNNMLYIKIGVLMFLRTDYKDLKILLRNLKEIQSVSGIRWHKELVGKKYYDLKYICIDEEYRHKGNFRKIMTSVIDYAKDNNLPIVLETYNIKNVPIYEHLGFELVKTMACENKTDLKQYCLIKKVKVKK